jgi:DNA-binding transcriptional regulator YdaS (Cro superfamily)
MENTLKEALASYPGGRQRFCKEAAISEGRLSQILKGQRASPELAIRIHRVTHGTVPASTLRPDLWSDPSKVPVEAGA